VHRHCCACARAPPRVAERARPVPRRRRDGPRGACLAGVTGGVTAWRGWRAAGRSHPPAHPPSEALPPHGRCTRRAKPAAAAATAVATPPPPQTTSTQWSTARVVGPDARPSCHLPPEATPAPCVGAHRWGRDAVTRWADARARCRTGGRVGHTRRACASRVGAQTPLPLALGCRGACRLPGHDHHPELVLHRQLPVESPSGGVFGGYRSPSNRVSGWN